MYKLTCPPIPFKVHVAYNACYTGSIVSTDPISELQVESKFFLTYLMTGLLSRVARHHGAYIMLHLSLFVSSNNAEGTSETVFVHTCKPPVVANRASSDFPISSRSLRKPSWSAFPFPVSLYNLHRFKPAVVVR